MIAPLGRITAGAALCTMAVGACHASAARVQLDHLRAHRLSIFFSPRASLGAQGLDRLKKALADDKGLELSPILLIEHFTQLETAPSANFKATVNSLREIVGAEFGLQLYDEAGLELARGLGIARLPAVALERGGRVHVAYGTDPDIEALLKCAK